MYTLKTCYRQKLPLYSARDAFSFETPSLKLSDKSQVHGLKVKEDQPNKGEKEKGFL